METKMPAPTAPPAQVVRQNQEKIGQLAEGKIAKKAIIQPGKKKEALYPYLHLGVGIFLTLVILGGIVFASGKLADLAGKTEMSRSQLVAMRNRGLSLKKLSGDLRSVAAEAEIINQALPDEAGIVSFVKKFREISRDVLLGVFNFQTDQPVLDEAGNAYIDFDVELKGSFANLKNFLTRLVKMPYLIKLQVVDIASADQEEVTMVITARIYVNEVFFKEGD